jgi:hypothetical protein
LQTIFKMAVEVNHARQDTTIISNVNAYYLEIVSL